jgi:hypothetical protein
MSVNKQAPLEVLSLSSDWKSPFRSVENTTFYNFIGAVSCFQVHPESALEFFAQHTTADLQNCQEILLNFIRLTHSACMGTAEEKSSCHITIFTWKHETASTSPPLWHRDGPLYPMKTGTMNFERSKYLVTLLGQPTEILVNSPEIMAKATQIYEADLRFDEMLREVQTAGFDTAPQQNVSTGQIVRMTWGEKDSPVHKEPLVKEDRVFMSVIYGTNKELCELAEWREEVYHTEMKSPSAS